MQGLTQILFPCTSTVGKVTTLVLFLLFASQKAFNLGKPVKISGVVITYNEERNLARCLESLKNVVDELLVVDSFSTDNTEAIARQYGARFIQHPFEGHIEQKNYAAREAQFDYVLSLDADEALDDNLTRAITAVKQNWQYDAYRMDRLNNYGGHWVRHGGWSPDYNWRLFDRRRAKWGGYNPHDKLEITSGGNFGKLSGKLLHYTYDPEDQVLVLTEHMNQINFFATRWAESAYAKNKRVWTLWHLVLRPPIQFVLEYIFKLGFLDGFTGYTLAKASAWHKYLKYLKLKALIKQNRKS